MKYFIKNILFCCHIDTGQQTGHLVLCMHVNKADIHKERVVLLRLLKLLWSGAALNFPWLHLCFRAEGGGGVLWCVWRSGGAAEHGPHRYSARGLSGCQGAQTTPTDLRDQKREHLCPASLSPQQEGGQRAINIHFGPFLGLKKSICE